MIQKIVENEKAMSDLAAQLAHAIEGGAFIFLHGQLGAGKTTFTRGFLRALGYQDKVKSPTYTLVEPYEISGKNIFHFDLYRLNDPGELELIGVQEYFSPDSICIVEWPDKGEGQLPSPDIECFLDFAGEGRAIVINAKTSRGEKILEKLS